MRRSICNSLGIIGVFLMLATVSATASEDQRLDPNVAPTAQSIGLKLDARSEAYSGVVTIELAVIRATTTFRFHAEDMELNDVDLRDADGPVDVDMVVGEDGLVTATTSRELVPGVCTLTIEFAKEYNTQGVGLYRTVVDGTGYLFTQFESVDARKAFPCWDEPAFKIPFQFSIELPEDQVVVTNTPVESETIDQGSKTVVFRETKPLPTYLLAIAAGPLESVPITGLSVPGRVYTVKGQSGMAGMAVETTPPILTALEAFFGRPYPYAKLDLIAVPEFWPGAMENAGAVTYGDRYLLIDPETASIGQKGFLVYATAHELSHMWFGDLVTMEWWDDLWLNESFATWLGEKVTEDLYPQYHMDIEAVLSAQRIMRTDARPSTKPIRRPVLSNEDIGEDLLLAYDKGKVILGMIEQWVGPVVFREGVLQYISDHEWGNATGNDLWSALSATSGKDVERPLVSFLDQPGFPMIDVSETDGGVVITQRRFLNYGVDAPPILWTVPVRMRYSSGGSVQTVSVLLADEPVVIETDGKLDWVMPNVGAHGYYRWNAPIETLYRLASDPENTMDEHERMAFLGNLSSLLDAGVIDGGEYLAIVGTFANYTDPGVIAALLADLGKIRNAFVPEELVEAFALYVRETLAPAKTRFGLSQRNGEPESVSVLRPGLLAWLGDEGADPEVREYALALALAYIDDPSSVDPSIAGVALQLAAIEGDRELFDAYVLQFENATVPAVRSNYLRAIGAFRDPALQDAALAYTLAGQLRANEVFRIPREMTSSPSGRDRVFAWMTANYDAITALIPTDVASYLPFLVSGCSEERLAAAEMFFDSPEHQVGGSQRNMIKVADAVNDCVVLRKREGAGVRDFLAGRFNSGAR